MKRCILAAIAVWTLLAAGYPVGLDALVVGEPSGRRGAFASESTNVRGDYISSPSPSVWVSSAALAAEPLSNGSTSHFADMAVIPGNTFYYYFGTPSGLEQKTPAYRTIYVSTSSPGFVILDGVSYSAAGLVESATVWHNWAGPPPPPANLTSFWSTGNDFVALSWDNPLFEGSSVLDITGGGGYEISRSSVSFDDGQILISSLTAVSGQLSYNDYSVLSGASYYYKIRAYDAYIPPLFSAAATTTPESRRTYVTLRFILDASDAGEVGSAAVVGDFTPVPYFAGRLDMDYIGGGLWRLDYSDVNLYDGASISYKYIADAQRYESDIPAALGGPFRTALVRDEGGGRMTLSDIWSVWTPTSTPSNLPEILVGFSASPGDNSVLLKWDYDPLSTGTISGYAVSVSSDGENYSVLASSDILRPATDAFADVSALNGATYYYRIASLSVSGAPGEWSQPLRAVPPSQGASVPHYSVASGIRFAPGGFAGIQGADTGVVRLRWTAASPDAALGPASVYVVRYASFPITDVDDFRAARVAGVARGRGQNSSHNMFTLNLGENNPGYYFAVCAVYGSWAEVSFSSSIVITAPVAFDASAGLSAAKGTRYFGAVSTASVVAALDIPPNALPKGNRLAVVRNLSELSADGAYSSLINSADETARQDARSGHIAQNSAAGTSSIFAFEIFDADGNDYFAPETGRTARKDMTVSLSYDGLDVAPEDLAVARLNEKNGFWRVLKDVKTQIDRDKKLIKFKTRSMSVYSLHRTGAPARDLAGVVVYPNPFKPHDGKYETGDYATGVRFANLTLNARVYIYNIAGEIVRHTGLTPDSYGDCRWDGKNEDGQYAASGVYVFVVKDESVTEGKNKFVGRLSIVR